MKVTGKRVPKTTILTTLFLKPITDTSDGNQTGLTLARAGRLDVETTVTITARALQFTRTDSAYLRFELIVIDDHRFCFDEATHFLHHPCLSSPVDIFHLIFYRFPFLK